MEQIKNSKGDVLPQPYLDLALMRREQQNGVENYIDCDTCFSWIRTPEDEEFWHDVNNGETPDIPAASLAELEAWRKSREENKQEAMVDDNPEPDYKAMYEDVKGSYEILDKSLHEALEKLQEQTDRNWIAECAMMITGGLSQGTHLPPNTEMIEYAWTLAEAWAAEGKKRGRI